MTTVSPLYSKCTIPLFREQATALDGAQKATYCDACETCETCPEPIVCDQPTCPDCPQLPDAATDDPVKAKFGKTTMDLLFCGAKYDGDGKLVLPSISSQEAQRCGFNTQQELDYRQLTTEVLGIITNQDGAIFAGAMDSITDFCARHTYATCPSGQNGEAAFVDASGNAVPFCQVAGATCSANPNLDRSMMKQLLPRAGHQNWSIKGGTITQSTGHAPSSCADALIADDGTFVSSCDDPRLSRHNAGGKFAMRNAEEVAQRQADLSKDGIFDFSTCCKPISSCQEFSFCGEFDEKSAASHATAGDDNFAYDEATCCVKPNSCTDGIMAACKANPAYGKVKANAETLVADSYTLSTCCEKTQSCSDIVCPVTHASHETTVDGVFTESTCCTAATSCADFGCEAVRTTEPSVLTKETCCVPV